MARKYNKEEILALRREKISKDRDLIFQNNTIINDRWIIQEKIDLRRTGEIYKAYDETLKKSVTMKTNKFTLSTIEEEAKILSLLKNSKHYCKGVFFSSNPFNILVTHSHGENLEDLRRRFGSFSLSAVLRIGLQMVSAIEELHKIGYIHRDINPSNLSMDQKNVVHIWDLSYAKRYRNSDNFLLPQRDKPGFCGDIKYASPRAHKELELCPADDFWSLLYTLLELRIDLPWEQNKEKGVEYYDDVENIKIKRIDYLITMHLSPDFIPYKKHIEKLDYADVPNYDLLRDCFKKIIINYNIGEQDQFDWQACIQHVWKIFTNKSTQQPGVEKIRAKSEVQIKEINPTEKEISENTSDALSPFRPSYKFQKQLLELSKINPNSVSKVLSYQTQLKNTISNFSKSSYMTNFTDASFSLMDNKPSYLFKPLSYFTDVSQKSTFKSNTLVIEPSVSMSVSIDSNNFMKKFREIHELPYLRRVRSLPTAEMISQECQVGETLESFLENVKATQINKDFSKITLLSKQSSKKVYLTKRLQESVQRLSQPVKRKKRPKSFVLPFPNYKYMSPEELACIDSKDSCKRQGENVAKKIKNKHLISARKAHKKFYPVSLKKSSNETTDCIESSNNASETLSQKDFNKENEENLSFTHYTDENIAENIYTPSTETSARKSVELINQQTSDGNEVFSLQSSRLKIQQLKKDVFARLNIKTLPEKIAQQKTVQPKLTLPKNNVDEVVISKKELSLATVYMDASSIHIRDKLRISHEKKDVLKRHRKDRTAESLTQYLLKVEMHCDR